MFGFVAVGAKVKSEKRSILGEVAELRNMEEIGRVSELSAWIESGQGWV